MNINEYKIFSTPPKLPSFCNKYKSFHFAHLVKSLMILKRFRILNYNIPKLNITSMKMLIFSFLKVTNQPKGNCNYILEHTTLLLNMLSFNLVLISILAPAIVYDHHSQCLVCQSEKVCIAIIKYNLMDFLTISTCSIISKHNNYSLKPFISLLYIFVENILLFNKVCYEVIKQ